jgi:hypothetical protein
LVYGDLVAPDISHVLREKFALAFNKPGRIGAFKPVRAAGMDKSRAEALAAEILAGLAEDPALLVRFINDTGIAPQDLMANAGSTEMLGAVLEHVLSDESLLLTLTASRNLKPEDLVGALNTLQKPALGSP